MVEFFVALEELAATHSIWIYLIIFFGKLLEVATSTLRIVLINRGIRMLGCILAVVEIVLWLLVTSTVLTSYRTDPLKALVYAIAFGAGVYVGSWLDEKLAFGLSSVQIVVSDICDAHNLCATLRARGYGVTTMDVHGIDDQERYMMVTMIKRKLLHELLHLINQTASSAVITVSDVKVQKGGYLRNAPARMVPKPQMYAKPKKARWDSNKTPPGCDGAPAAQNAQAAPSTAENTPVANESPVIDKAPQEKPEQEK